jgi:protein involved in plasmid replication-relaxation
MSRSYLTAAGLQALQSRLTEHDLSVLQRVSDLRFVTGDQLTRLCFADTDDQAANGRAARRALLRLTRLGALERLPRQVGGARAGSAGYVYCLGVGGQRLALLRGWQPERRRRRSQTPGTLFVRHALQVSELHALLVTADRSRRIELLELSGEPACWRSWGGVAAQRQTLKPDSYARLGVGAYEYSYFIEVDRGTEGSQTIVRQLAVYVAYYMSGTEQAARGVFPRVLWLAPDSKRVAAIEDCVAQLPRADRELFRVVRFEDAVTVMQASTDKE